MKNQNLDNIALKKSIDTEKDLEKMQELAMLSQESELSKEDFNELHSLTEKYIETHQHDVPYYNEGNTDYKFFELSNGLFLRANAHLRANNFTFDCILSREKAESEIEKLAKQQEKEINKALKIKE